MEATTRANLSEGRGRRYRRAALLVLLVLLLGAGVLLLPVLPPVELTRVAIPEGADSVRVIAGARYGADPIHRLLLGSHYRELWTEPVMVAVLKLGEVDGGLRPFKEGGSRETRGLHFHSRAGHHLVFRSVDKEVTRLLGETLRRSLVARLVQDEVSASHPAGALIAAPLQGALGLPDTHPRLVVMPDDPALGAFRARFAGLLGVLAEVPEQDRKVPPGDSAGPVITTDELFALLDAGPGNRVDARRFVTARLLDLLLNDWDRHEGQWRWRAVADSAGTRWLPIPSDRDQAFARYEGLLIRLARLHSPKLSAFGPEYPGIVALTTNSATIDGRLLRTLPRPAWDSAAAFVRARLTDSVIDAAVRRLPDAWWQSSGPPIAAALRQRREGLAAEAARFYTRVVGARAR